LPDKASRSLHCWILDLTGKVRYIQWGIKWGGRNGNWIDSTTNTSGQEPIALAWNLAEIQNTWGEKVTFNYDVDLELIGNSGYQYTRATYLKQITAIDGRSVNFVYQLKQYDEKVREYQIPHEYSGQSNLHAYQDRYETKFLDSIELRDKESNSILFSLQFDYEVKNVSLNNFNNADFYKRYLTGITQKNANKESLPGYKFGYYTKSDDLTDNIHRGALKNITYATGGIATFNYEKKNLVGTSHIENISGYGIPRVWFGGDYVVVAYYDESRGSLDVKVYSWNGNWISDEPSAGGFNFKLDIDSLQIVTQSDFFALSFKQKDRALMNVYLFHQEIGRFGKWSYKNYFLDLALNDVQTHLAVGNDFVFFCASGGTNLGLYVWNQQSKSWNDKNINISISKGNYALAALGNYFTIAIYDADSKKCDLVLYYQDEIYKQWNNQKIASISPVEKDDKGNPYLNWSLSNHSATVTFIKTLSSDIDYEVRVYQWDAEFNVTLALSNSYSVPQGTKDFNYSIMTGSLLANAGHLWRYNGSEWKKESLTVANKVTKFAYGSDLAIAVSANSNDIKQYDPYRDNWTNANLQDSWSNNEYEPTISGNFVTIGNGIFYRDNQGQLNKDRQSIPSEIKPNSIINRAPFYIACETSDGESQILLLKNGKVVHTESLSKERIYVDNESSKGKSGTMLAGFNAFVTYKGDNFDKASNLTLYYVFDESIKGNVTDFPTVKVSINDGYQESQTSYDYDTSKIAISVQGIVTEYSQVTVIKGSDNPKLTPFGKTEHLFFNGLSAEGLGFKDFKGMPPYYYSVLHGSLYQQKVYDSNGDQLTRQSVEYDIVTERERLGESGKVNLYGYYIQQKREESILYSKEISSIYSNGNASNVGVKREVEYEYDSATGLLKTQTTKNYNSLGEEETLTQTSVYGWEKYEELRQQNILTPVVQTVSKTNEKTTAIAVSTWKDWGDGKWGLFRTYQGLNESAVFEQWDNQTEPNLTDWLKASEVISRTLNGVTQDSIDVNGIHSSILSDKEQFYPVAQFDNASLKEANYTGFEDYENLSNWGVNQRNITDLIVKGDAHTGVSSLQLKPSLTLNLKTPLSLTNTQQVYLVSAWIKTEAGFETDGGKAEVKLQFYNGNNPVSNPIIIPIEATDNDWKYLHYAIKPSQIQETQLGIEISNQKVSKFFLIDDLCFAPLLSGFQANVYDTKYKLVTAQLGNSGDTSRHFYDSFQRKVAEIGLNETVNALTTSYLNRQDTDSVNYVFPQDKPNSSLSIGATEGGVYANFINGEQWRQDWQSSQLNNWQVENGALVHTGNTSDNITYQSTTSFSNYGVRLSVHASDTPKQPLGICIGNQLTVTWTQNQGWILTINGVSSQVANTGLMAHEWLLVAANNVLLFYADGQQIFAQTVTNNITGALALFTADKVAFSNIVTFKNPQIGITYSDGAGKERQTQALEGSNCLVTETVYDSLGRGVISTKTARFDNTLLGYRQKFVETVNWDSGILTGEVADHYPDDQGYPYSRTVYEASPLSRPIQQGIPGKAFAIGNNNTHIITSEYGTNLQGFFAEDSYPPHQYLVEKVTDADGTLVYTLKDQLGRTLAKKAGPIEAGSNIYQTTRSIYDAAGNVVKTLLPNHFDPPAGSQSDAWEITMEYDFLGQMISQTNPDSGTTKYIYDRAGRPRFMVDAVGLETRIICYKKYDIIGRLIEEGWLSGDWGDGTDLQNQANSNPHYPEQGNWRKRYVFDGDGSNPHLIGRLWQVLNSNLGDGNSDVEEIYDYDELGNVASKTLTVTGYAAQTVRYEYNNLGNIIKVIYPNNSNIPEVVYSYNSLGETIAVGTPENIQQFATYRYNADGSLATTTLNNGGLQNSLNYNSPGWPTHIDNKKADDSLMMEQSFAYTENGYQDSGYYNGNIAQNSINYGTWKNPPQNYDYQYQYDQLGRLKVAQNSQDEKASLGVGQPTTYDINGNIQTLKQGDTTNQYKYIENTDKVNRVSNSSEPQNYGYDANGNVKSASHRQISEIKYDPLTQLTTQIQLEGNTSVFFKYNGGNQRVLKTSQDSSGNQTAGKLYVHGLNDYPLLEVSNEPIQYIYGLGGLVALVKEGKIYTILKDHLGSTRVVVDEAGTVIAAFDYLPFGDLMGTAYGNPEFISYRYTGQEFDAELGLYNYRARFYDPRLGRFYATDPKGQFASPYLYAGNNPIIYVDPDGQLAWWGWLGIALAVVAVGVVTIATAGAAAPVLAALTGEIVKDTIIASTLVAAGEGLVTIGASVAVVGTALSGCSSGGTVSVPTSSGGASGSGSVPTSSSGGFGSGSGGGGDERRPPKRDSYTGHYAPITRARKRKILRRYPGINPDNIVHGRRLRRPPDRYGFSRQPRFVPIEGNRWGLDPGTYYRASVRIQYNLTSADDIAEADQWLINQGLPPRDPNTEVWHHFHDYDPNTNTGTLYLMLRIYHWLGHSGGRWQYDRGW
jgi:RHS repeat-associated protein